MTILVIDAAPRLLEHGEELDATDRQAQQRPQGVSVDVKLHVLSV